MIALTVPPIGCDGRVEIETLDHALAAAGYPLQEV
jgi:hypothetical protein